MSCNGSGTLSTLLAAAVLVTGSLHPSLQPARAESVGHKFGAGEGGEHEFHPNFAAFFVGFTGEGRRDNGFALGIEYERRFNKSFGIGLFAERTFGDLEFWVVGVPFAWHKGPLKLYAAPGIEDIDGISGIDALVRIGALYGFEAGRVEIAPQLAYDVVAGENAVVLGVTFGWGF